MYQAQVMGETTGLESSSSTCCAQRLSFPSHMQRLRETKAKPIAGSNLRSESHVPERSSLSSFLHYMSITSRRVKKVSIKST